MIPWIVLLVPLLSAALILIFTHKSGFLSSAISVTAAAIACLGSCIIFHNTPEAVTQLTWLNLHLDSLSAVSFHPAFPTPPYSGLNFTVPIGFTLDHLSKLMLLVVTIVGLLVHIYSLGYMRDDKGKSRYFAGLSLFMFSMLGIVLSNNFVMMFIFWELVGISSYLLIGHWFENPAAADAAKKAFLVNRIGDFGFMLGILMFWGMTGVVDFAHLQTALPQLLSNPKYVSYIAAATLLVFCGPIGKSAQCPLHVWLPDAMEGPTPVSALIHAATMVAAGVYLLARISFIIGLVPVAQTVIAWVGIITALLAALMATQQNDIKRILAYSTISQLGYMISAMGLVAPGAGMFHLFTHAFFKALLFLGSGSVIYALHHEQNIWKMGGLWRSMPITFWTFVAGTLALTGCPFFSGFFSKDEILVAAANRSIPIFAIGLFAALLTAFYMTRLVVVAFLNPDAAHASQEKLSASYAAAYHEHEHEDGEVIQNPLHAHMHAKNHAQNHASHVKESPWVMTIPLILLAIPAIFAGYLPVRHYLDFAHGTEAHAASSVHIVVSVLAFFAFAIGVLSAFFLYRNRISEPIHIPLFEHKFYFDEIYAWCVRFFQDSTAGICAWIDRWGIDGIGVRGASGTTFGLGFVLRFLQVGNLQAYAFLFSIGVVVILYIALFT